jgi:methyltransferase (TIGR00027 family)
MTDEAAINSVADTALWVATFRAAESARPDAVFHDSLASILAGERGRRTARSIPRSASMAWGVVIRTSAIDRLIREALEAGVDTVLNLGAGWDTRPYRMDLPSHIRWIEMDLPELIESKNYKLRDHTPACRLERMGLDLMDRPSRVELFTRYGATSQNCLLIAEGVIPYLSNDDVAGIARDLLAIPAFRHWILDFDNAGKRPAPRSWAKKFETAPFLFQVNDWFEFFRHSGWRPHKVITSADESERLNRPFPLEFPLGLLMRALPKEVSRKILNLSGAVLMEKG